jgi:hypothetical protein
LVIVREATETAWSDDVPVPNAKVIIIVLPNRRGMKKSLELLTWRDAQKPSNVMPIR